MFGGAGVSMQYLFDYVEANAHENVLAAPKV